MKILFITFLTGSLFASIQAADQPNILLIMADDLRDFGGAFTKKVVKTPNLDRLRARGTTFDRAFVQYPVCNPSRCSMMTGLRTEQTRITNNTDHLRQKLPDIVTMPQLCKDAGWQSHAFGKLYHLGGGKDGSQKAIWADVGRSWHTAQDFNATKVGNKMLAGRNVTGGTLKWCSWGAADGGDDDQPDGQIAAATVAMINQLGAKPWFIGCGFMKPHDPFIAPKKYFDLYPPGSLIHWRDPADLSPAPPQAVGFSDYGGAFAKLTDKDWNELFRAYCASTTFMDAQVGRVLDALDQNKLWEKTVVIFVGDHGYHTGERKWWNKNTLFERSCRAPLIIAAPGMKGNQVSHSLVEFVDLYPSVAEFCGLRIPHPFAGTNLKPILANPDAVVKGAAFTVVTRGRGIQGQSVRTVRWRLTRWSDGAIELYDHDRDPEENHNLFKEYPAVVKEMDARLAALPAYQPSP
jgi:iduronate 2-sulfatase